MYNVIMCICVWMATNGGVTLGTVNKLMMVGRVMDFVLFICLAVFVIGFIVSVIDTINANSEEVLDDKTSDITKMVSKIIG